MQRVDATDTRARNVATATGDFNGVWPVRYSPSDVELRGGLRTIQVLHWARVST